MNECVKYWRTKVILADRLIAFDTPLVRGGTKFFEDRYRALLHAYCGDHPFVISHPTRSCFFLKYVYIFNSIF